jgi:thioesterase domain-containing protein
MFEILLDELHEKGIEISVVHGKLCFEGPEQYITDELLEKLRTNKSNLIKHFWPLKNSNLLPINPVGNKPPVILLHGERGNYYFSEYFGNDQPFYGFLHLGSDGEKVKIRTVEEFAEEYIKQILATVPKGPLIVGGFSFGGIIAYEMACRLKEHGYEVAMLIMVDCISPLHKGRIFKKGLFNKVKRYFLGPMRRFLKKRIQLTIAKAYHLVNKPIPISRRSFYILANYGRANARYKPGKYDGNVLLFRANTNLCDVYSLGWDKLVNGKIEIIDFEGDHKSIIEDSENAKMFTIKILQKIMEIQKINETSKG